MANTETMRDKRGSAPGSQVTNQATTVTLPQIVDGHTAVGHQSRVREGAVQRNGIGWLIVMLVFFCMMIVPFAIGTFVLFVR